MAGLFDKVVVGLNKGVNSVSEGSKSLIEKAKINTQIQDLEKEKNKLLINMGNLIYNLQQSGDVQIEQCGGICAEISNYNDQISELQLRLQELDINKQPQQSQLVPSNENGVVCECGFTNKVTAKFCSQCGKPLN